MTKQRSKQIVYNYIWGTAAADWIQAAIIIVNTKNKDFANYLYFMRIWDMGKEFTMSRHHLNQRLGMNCLRHCYDYFLKFWGENDKDVMYMKNILNDTDISTNSNLYENNNNNFVICMYNDCPLVVDDSQCTAGNLNNFIKCELCGLAYYCSINCQTADRSHHEYTCQTISALQSIQQVIHRISNSNINSNI